MTRATTADKRLARIENEFYRTWIGKGEEKMRKIEENTIVAYDAQGNEIPAERLQKWAYNQLAAAPDLKENGHVLAVLALQSDRYLADMYFREAVDAFLEAERKAEGKPCNT